MQIGADFFSLCLTTCRLNNEGQPTSICIENLLRIGTVVGKYTNMWIILWGNDPLNGGDKSVTVFKSKKRRTFDFRASSVFFFLYTVTLATKCDFRIDIRPKIEKLHPASKIGRSKMNIVPHRRRGGSQSGSEDHPSVNSLPVAYVHTYGHTHSHTFSRGSHRVWFLCCYFKSPQQR